MYDTLAYEVSHAYWRFTVGGVTARGLGWALLALVVGASLGLGAAYATRPEPEASGTPAPVPARAPSVPTDDPFASDIDWDPLTEVDTFETHRIGEAPQFQTWEYPVPEGWVAYLVTATGDRPIPSEEVGKYFEVRFRPENEPLIGGFSMRVKAINNHSPSADEVEDKISDFERLYEDVDVLEQTDETVFFTFRTEEEDRLRYNFFHWFEAPDSDVATLEMSLAGRAVDEPGLRALFDEFAKQARPLD